MQSKDLSEKSAQKACSVSPAHFRSTLALCRRLLKSIELPALDSSPSRRTRATAASGLPATAGPSTFATDGPTGEGDADQTNDGADLPPAATGSASPFNTPRKKLKYSSGIDISSLVRNTPKSAVKGQHEPNTASPLRHSVTPSKRSGRGLVTPVHELDEEEDEADVQTPTKRVKYGVKGGVDLDERVEVPPVLSTRKRTEDAGAFFALRPGGDGTASAGKAGRLDFGVGSTGMGSGATGRIPVEDGLPEVRLPARREKREKVYEKSRRRKDWTYRETAWGSRQAENQETLRKVCCFVANHANMSTGTDRQLGEEMPLWLEANGRQRQPVDGSLEDILLARLTPVV